MTKTITHFFNVILCLTVFFLLYLPCLGLAMEESAGNDYLKEEIIDLDFWADSEGFLYVSFKGSDIPLPEVRTMDDAGMQAVIPGFQAPLSMIRLYRLDDFGSELKSLFLRNTEHGVRLIWSWDREVDFQVSADSQSLTYRFARAVQTSGQSSDADTEVSEVQLAGQPQRHGLDRNSAEASTIFPGMQEEYTGTLISLDLQNAEVQHVIRHIVSITDYNLVMDEDVRGRITLHLINPVPWDQALDIILIQKNLGMVHIGNIIRVTTAQKLEAERAQARRAREDELRDRESIKQLEPLEREFIQINYSTATEMLSQIRDFLSERGRVSQDPRTNTLIVQDTPSHIRDVKALIDNLDRPERQVYIEARIVYATEEFRRGLGINWNFMYPEQNAFSPRGNMVSSVDYSSMNFPTLPEYSATLAGTLERLSGSRIFTLDAQLHLGEAQNQSRTVSAPKIITLNNVRAEIEQGVRIPIQVPDERGTRTDFEDAVLRLAVQPQITADNRLILDLELTDDSPSGDGIDTRVTRTKFLIDNGETIVIGGIKRTSAEQREGRIPGLGRMPALGWLFKNQYISDSKNELLIFIRPEIL